MAAAGEEPEQAAASNGIIVAIDPGHQAKADTEKEPIGPGASTMKAKVEDGATGEMCIRDSAGSAGGPLGVPASGA